MAADDLTAILGRDYLLPDDTPRLVAAIEAVLKEAGSAEVWSRASLYCNCGECNERRRAGKPALHTPRAMSWTLDPAKVRETISRSLSGKEEPGDG